MRYVRAIASASALAFTAACAEKATRDLTAPEANTPVPAVTAPVSSPYCAAKTDTEIQDAIDSLYFKNDWPDPNSALSKFAQVTAALDIGDITAARLATRNLVEFITNKYNHLTPAQQAAAANDYNELIADLWCFVGISGQVFDLNPDDPPKVFTIPGVGGVWFPGNVVPVGTLVVLTDLTGEPSFPGLTTPLDQWASYIDIQLIPEHTFTEPNLPIVVVCPEAGAPTGLYLGHDAPGGFELLPPVDFSGITELTTLCGPASVQHPAPQGWLASWVNRAASFVLPRPLQASMMLAGGIGGSPSDFSPFGAVSTTLVGTNGLGGSTTEFSPRPEAGPPVARPLGTPSENRLDGVAGTSGNPADPDWPVVTIKTVGGDSDGQNPIQGVTVTFTIGAAETLDPDSEARLCDGDTDLTSVQVVTDANGVAALPCLRFGTKAGFANIQATFDPATIGFPGDQLLTINSSAYGESSAALNWLVETTAGAAAYIYTYMPPGPDTAATHAYGSGLVEGSAASPAPQVLVTDQWSNPVGGVGIQWSPLSDANGAILVPGAAGTQTNSLGVATAESWTLGAGLNTLTARFLGAGDTPSESAATFTATTPTGISLFACTVGGNKTDIGWMSIPKPSGTVREITLYMSVTGQSSSEATYNATVEVRKNSSTGALLGALPAPGGGITLPGNNGSPRAITLRLSDPVTPTDMAGTGQNATNTLWIGLTFTNLPGTRKIQVWYNNSITKSNQGPCYNSLVYNPGSTTLFKRGLGINVTN